MLKPNYRVKQFYLCITDKMDIHDKIFIEKYLNKTELKLFKKLSDHEQKHSVRVAYGVQSIYLNKYKGKINLNRLVKVSLLHDIGKIYCKLNAIDKSVLVIFDILSKGRLKKLDGIKKINIYYNHAERGYNLLKGKGYDPEFLYLVRNHHNLDIEDNIELNILRMCDNIN
ncbi:HD domain-containing protein [Clostridium rectalis]|uniref:HD domain-containing protein n=1 Tax=Clostridium rectalis TaxID=2040295 RepID=UPI000F640C4B|nr:HD domain-containing protein [Clostridium rectalis]